MKARVTASLAIGLALLAASCSTSDPITSSVGTLAMRAEANPVYAGRFNFARFQVARISLEPLAADTDTLSVDLSLLPTRAAVDLRSSAPITTSPIRLSPGLYRVVSLTTGSFALNTGDTLPEGSVCVGGTLESMRAQDDSPIEIFGELIGGGTAPVVQVSDATDTPVFVRVDGPGLVNLLESRYNCEGNFLEISPELLAPLFSVN